MPACSFTVLGSSSGTVQADRACSGYVLKTGGSLTLLDCGGGVVASLLRCGFNLLDIDRVFISHTHPDHCSDLPLFIQQVYLGERSKRLDLFLPGEFVRPFRDFLNAVYLIPERFPCDLNLVGYQDGYRFQGPFMLRAIGNRHLSGLGEWIDKLSLPNRMQCHSFLISGCGRTLYYSSDVYDLDDIRPHLAKADLAIVESKHIDIPAFLELAQGCHLEKVFMSHLDLPEDVERLRQAISKSGMKNVVIAHDGLTIEV